jgi:protoporphyrinogen IX oxidase
MIDLSVEAYLYVKAAHIISVISWMAGLLYLPRLYVYHTETIVGSELSETFKVMERRLLRAIMTPAMLASLLFGGILIAAQPEGALLQIWLIIKLLSAFFLIVMHMVLAKWRKEFAEDRNIRPQKFYRYANEVPTILMIVIVVFAVVKPF